MGELASRRLIAPAGVAAVAIGVLALVPRVAGTTWAGVGAVLAGVSAPALAVMAGIWATGLWFHSFALAAALPGLTKRRALTLSLTGSAVANVLPLGGAAGIGLNFAMVRRWGLSARSFAAFTAVTNLLDVLARLAVTAVATVLVIRAGATVSLPSGTTRAIGAALLVVSPPLGAILASDRIAGSTGAAADRLIGLLTRSRIRSTLAAGLPELRESTVRIMRTRWLPLGGGTACYLISLGVLLWWCFHALHVDAGPLMVLAGLAVDRFLTMIPVTPGGAGVVEAGSIAALVALGGPPATVVAAVLLYRCFTFVAEIPVGGIGLGLWLLRYRGSAPAVEALR